MVYSFMSFLRSRIYWAVNRKFALIWNMVHLFNLLVELYQEHHHKFIATLRNKRKENTISFNSPLVY